MSQISEKASLLVEVENSSYLIYGSQDAINCLMSLTQTLVIYFPDELDKVSGCSKVIREAAKLIIDGVYAIRDVKPGKEAKVFHYSDNLPPIVADAIVLSVMESSESELEPEK